jgi:hypothetical protein
MPEGNRWPSGGVIIFCINPFNPGGKTGLSDGAAIKEFRFLRQPTQGGECTTISVQEVSRRASEIRQQADNRDR